MTKSNMKITFTIPFSPEKDTGSCIGFSKWIPEGVNNNIVSKIEETTVTLYFDKNCIASLFEKTDESLKNNDANQVYQVYAEVAFDKIDKELTSFIYDERDSSQGKHHGLTPEKSNYNNLNSKYLELGKKALKTAITVVNRLLSFARNTKGQYWLNADCYAQNHQNLNNYFRATATINDGKVFRWSPPGTNSIRFSTVHYPKTYIRENEWNAVKKFIDSQSKSNILFELLSNAHYLNKTNHNRSALIECVTALEIAVNNFTKSPNLDELIIPEHKARIDTKNIGSQSGHLGFSGTLRYLIPILIDSTKLEDDILKTCFDALQERNNIIHNGQRSIDNSKIDKFVNAVTHCCNILDKYTLKK